MTRDAYRDRRARQAYAEKLVLVFGQLLLGKLMPTLSSLCRITSLHSTCFIYQQNPVGNRDRYCGSHVPLDGKTQSLA